MKPLPTFGSPISDFELWQCARQQLDQLGNDVLVFDARRMEQLQVIDDRPGYATWIGIAIQIAMLGPPGSPPTQ